MAKTVYVGSARSDENGKAYNGQAGDQKSGKEVSTQAWYKHSKGWRVFRAKDPADAAKIAEIMRWACGTNQIGYDQYQRHTLYKELAKNNFKSTTLSKAVETDCSALVRVCLAFCGISVPEEFRTGNMPKYLLDSGKFVELKGSKYTEQSAYLGEGDILVTKTNGHTVVATSTGDKYEGTVQEKEYELNDRILKNGMSGPDVKLMQSYLIDLGYDLGVWGDDGDFGDCTELALMKFQEAHGCAADGEYGPITHKALMAALDDLGKPVENPKQVKIVGGQCWIRTEPNTTGEKLGVAKEGAVYAFAGQTSEDGWHLIAYNNQTAWVSGKYGKLTA